MSRAYSVFLASLLAAWCGVAGAQGFGSVSSGPDAAPARPAADAPADAAPAAASESSTTTPAFSSQQAGGNPFLTGSAARAAAAAPTAVTPDAVAEAPAKVATAPASYETTNAFSTGAAATADSGASNPFLTGSAAASAAAQAPPLSPSSAGSATSAAAAANPFLTGSAAAAAAESAAQASNPFLTGSAARRLATMPGWTAPATATTMAAATTPATAIPSAGSGPGLGAKESAGTLAFGSNYADAIAGPARIRAPADRILVKKSERRLYLLKGGQVIAEYPIRLGLNPTGPKRYEGDFRTPEGRYELVRRNPNSEYFLSLEVSYPNDQDLERAREIGKPPGGLIMIHGQPNLPSKSAEYYKSNDWTNGCIAVSNPDMVDIWLRTDLGTPIEIQP